MPARASDQCQSTRPLRACQRGPHCTTFPGSIEASLAVEMTRRSPSVGNPLLPARAEGTLLWIISCIFRAVRVDPPWPTWSVLAFARFCWHVRGTNTDMCQIVRKYDTKSRAVHSCPALYENKVASGAFVSAFEHIPYSACGSVIRHVASNRIMCKGTASKG